MQRKLITLAVLLAVLGAGSLALVLLGDDGDAAGDVRAIEVEQFTTPEGLMEILVTVSDEVNVPETAGGATTVSFECLDSEDEVVLQSQQTWPLSSDGTPPAAHVHQPASPTELRQVAKCRFPDLTPRLEGRLGLNR